MLNGQIPTALGVVPNEVKQIREPLDKTARFRDWRAVRSPECRPARGVRGPGCSCQTLGYQKSARCIVLLINRSHMGSILACRDHRSIWPDFGFPIWRLAPMTSDAFEHRSYPDGTRNSFCPKCRKKVAVGITESDLKVLEMHHICNFSGLSDSVIPGYVTLTERVLVFLEGHNA